MRQSGSPGFALPLVLFGIALVSLSLFALLQSGEGRVRQVRATSERLAADLAAETATARVSYLLAAEPLGVRSIAVSRAGAAAVFLDGRAYVVESGDASATQVRVQDEAGLLNLNSADEPAIARLLQTQGVSEREAVARAATLADYMDGDDLRRLGGADGAAYKAAGLSRPRNRPLDMVTQAFGALGWRGGIDGGQASDFISHTTVSSARASFNPNTATRAVLQSALAIDARTAERVIAAREKQSVLTMDDVVSLTGTTQMDLHSRAAPARNQRLTITVAPTASQEIYVYVLRLSIAQDEELGPISQKRLETPTRARSRERARSEGDVQADILPVRSNLPAPRKR